MTPGPALPGPTRRPLARARGGAESGLYPRLLGPGWDRLAPAVRRAHADGDVLVGIGTFGVAHGVGRLARLLAGCGAVPPASDACPVRVTIRRHGLEERWHRRLAGTRLVTVQRAAPDGLLAERLGALELVFRLSVVDGALVYRQVAAMLRLGPFRPRLPARLAPRVAARERPDDDGISTNVAVEITLPTGGLLLAYRGRVRWAASRAGAARR